MNTQDATRLGLVLAIILVTVPVAHAAPGSELTSSATPAGISSSSENTSHTQSSNGTISSCTVIEKSGSYELITDIVNSSADTCIEITASDVTLNGNGHTVDGVDDASTGVYVHGVNETNRIKNVAIQNLTIRDWGAGIAKDYVSSGSISNTRIVSNIGVGIRLRYHADEVMIENNDILRNSRESDTAAGVKGGFNSDHVTLTNNSISDNRGTAVHIAGNFSRVVNNTIANNDWMGIRLQEPNADHGTVRNNTVVNNGGGLGNPEIGIFLQGASNNVIAGNNVSGNNDAGIRLRIGFSTFEPVKENVIRNNTIRNNGNGISLKGAVNNVLRENTLAGNSNANIKIEGPFDRFFDHTITTTNIVEGKPVYYLVGESDTVIDAETNAGFVGVIDSHNVTVRNLSLSKNRFGAVFVDTHDSTIRNVSTTRNNNGGLLFQNSSGIILADSNVSNNSQRGVVLRGAKDMVLRNNTITENGPAPRLGRNRGGVAWQTQFFINQVGGSNIGAFFHSARDNTLRNNTISNNEDSGIFVSRAEGTTLINNNVSNNDREIHISNSHRAQVVDNTVLHSGFVVDGISVSGTGHVIANNAISGDIDAGITLSNDWTPLSTSGLKSSTNNTVSNNTLSGVSEGLQIGGTESEVRNNTVSNSGRGISLVGDAILVARNNFSDNSGSGIRIWRNGDNNTITSNTVSDNGGGIFLRPSADNNTLLNNDALRNFGSGIRVTSSDNVLINNNVSHNREFGIVLNPHFSQDEPASDNVLENNTVINTTGRDDATGIFLRSVLNTTLKGNTLARNRRNLGVDGTQPRHFDHTITTTNIVEGKPVYYLVGESDTVIDAETNAGFVGVVNTTNVTVRDIDPPDNFDGVLFANVSNSTIRNVTATNNSQGIRLIDSENITLIDNIASRNKPVAGIHLVRSENNTLINNTASNNEGTFPNEGNGIFLKKADNNTLIRNNASNNIEVGITHGFQSDRSTLINNTVLDNGDRGITANDNNTLRRNIVSSNSGSGITVESDNILVNNTASNSTLASGIIASDNNTLINNTAAYNGDDGIRVDTNNTLTNNTASNNGEDGIETAGSRLINNSASHNVESGIKIYGDGTTLIDNVVSDNGANGLRVSGSNATLTNNTARNNTWDFVASSSSGTVVERLTIGSPSTPMTVSFTLNTGWVSFGTAKVKLRSAAKPPADPGSRQNISKHVEATVDVEEAWVNLTVHYTDSDVTDVNESTLEMWRHNATGWANVSGFNTVNTSRNTVSANVTEFSVLVPVGEPTTTTTCIADSVSGSDDTISLTEIQDAINWWAEGKEVPDTGGETISLSKIQSLINAWAEDTTVSCS